MPEILIIYPVFALVWWTLMVLMLVPYRRIKAVRNKELGPKDFRLGESANVSEYVALANRNYINLLEVPVIFYVVCFTIFLTGGLTQLSLILAWAYVGFRFVHSVIHLSYNNVQHRLYSFVLSVLTLIALVVTTTFSLV